MLLGSLCPKMKVMGHNRESCPHLQPFIVTSSRRSRSGASPAQPTCRTSALHLVLPVFPSIGGRKEGIQENSLN